MLFAKDLFSKEEKLKIQKAIENAEMNTSGEIRVHIESNCSHHDPVERAKEMFVKLKMHQTQSRNGVIFYLATGNKKFAIYGDEGIHLMVTDAFWQETKDQMQADFKNGQFTEGLCKGILHTGEKLKQHFPYQANDKNELDNEVSFGN